MAGMLEAGFFGIHVNKSSPWRVIDGIHFISITVTGYKLPSRTSIAGVKYATLCGPFSRVVDERGPRTNEASLSRSDVRPQSCSTSRRVRHLCSQRIHCG